MKIKIVADSSSDMHAVTDENFEIVPLKIVNSEKEYVDTKELNVYAMAEDLKNYKGKTSTSCPNTSDWLKAFDGAGLSRVDFFVRYSDNSVVLNEINTMPGFTSISMYPKLWDAVGLKYSDLLDELIKLGMERVK